MLGHKPHFNLINLLIIIGLLSLLMLLYFFTPRNYLSGVRLQSNGYLYSIANLPSVAISNLATELKSKSVLQGEFNLLQIENKILSAEVGRLQAIKQENIEMRRLLSSIDSSNYRVLVANITSELPNFGGHRVLLNKGKSNNVRVGHAVTDGHGLFGQVIEVSNNFSQVILISDRDSSVPVFNARTSFRTLTKGTNDFSKVKLQLISQTMDIKIGDVFFTSGIGDNYPRSIKVGSVSNISPISRGGLLEVELETSAQLRNSSMLLLLSNE